MHQVRWRVLRERLARTLEHAENFEGHDDLVRLAALGLALLCRHAVDAKGRCRYCRAWRGWWRRRSRRCMVLPMVAFYMEQPQLLVTRSAEESCSVSSRL